MIVESDLDAILIDQEASNLVSVISLGSCCMKPDVAAHSLLRESKRIAVSLDYDKAGKDASAWWLKHYKQAKKVFTPEGKDPGDFALRGGPVDLWVKVAIE
jgi:DNA primase